MIQTANVNCSQALINLKIFVETGGKLIVFFPFNVKNHLRFFPKHFFPKTAMAIPD